MVFLHHVSMSAGSDGDGFPRWSQLYIGRDKKRAIKNGGLCAIKNKHSCSAIKNKHFKELDKEQC